MDRKLAESLIAPLAEGQTIARDWRLKQIEIANDGASVEYHIGRTDFRLQLTPKEPSKSCFAQSRNFNLTILCDHDTMLSRAQETLMQHVCRLIQKNDTGDYRVDTGAPPQAPTPTSDAPSSVRSNVFMVPGHLGNPRDVSVRALDLLARCTTIFIETGEEAVTVDFLNHWGIDATTKRLIGLPPPPPLRLEDVVDQLAVAGEDACVFGGNEGLPGFHDPCESLMPLLRGRADIRLRTVGGGSALSAATMMVTPTDQDQSFLFLGHLEVHNTPRLLDRLARYIAVDASGDQLRPSYVFYSSGGAIKAAWQRLSQLCAGLDGEFCLNANLNWESERALRVPMASLDQFDVHGLDDLDKLVIWLHP